MARTPTGELRTLSTGFAARIPIGEGDRHNVPLPTCRTEDLARPRGVEIETAAGNRLYESARREDAPRIVEELVAAGERVYGVRVLETTLEEIYLEAVEGHGS